MNKINKYKMNEYISDEKIDTIYLCTDCNYKTRNKQHFNRHLTTIKHIMTVRSKYDTNIKKYTCKCGKSYSHRSGLCKHRKKCCYDESIMSDMSNFEYEVYDGDDDISFATSDDKNNLILTLIRQNDEFKQMLVEQNKRIMEMMEENQKEEKSMFNSNSYNTTTNHFNLQVFLNVTCKDAMNMSDFINSISVDIEDLEETGRLGYVEGISKIFINKLNELNMNDRPMYCTDLRREIIYIKDNNVWEKETPDRKKLKCVIKTITHNNMKQILVWQKNNPDWNDPSTSTNDKYLQIVSNNMSGISAEEEQQNYDKIISKVAKEILIPKRNYISQSSNI